MTLLTAGAGKAQWVAYNDNVPGSATHPNATTNNIRLQMSGALKDVVTGTNLPVTLAITHSSSGIVYSAFGQNPLPNTALYNSFNGFVVFGPVSGATDANVELTNGALSTVTYSFSGLNPLKHYSFKGGAIRGLSPAQGSNRWTRVEIAGATSFGNAHSSNVVTSAQASGDLADNQVAVNFAVNIIVGTGDMVDWEDIAPDPSGSFAIICSQYQGFVPTTVIPGGGHSNGTNGYAITGIRLEELPSGPPVIVLQPQDQSVISGQAATFIVSAIGQRPLSYQWYRDGSAVSGATSSNYTTAPTTIRDYGSRFHVMVYNSLGSVTSSNTTLLVNEPPVAFLPYTNLWKYDQSGADLGTAWKEIAYTNDEAWPSGRGVLGQETDNQTVLPLTNTVLSLTTSTGTRITTYYFRTHFMLDYPDAYSMVASNLVDDGAIVYVNGQEVERENVTPAPAIIHYSTLASASIEAAWNRYQIPSSFFVAGDNVIAAEVHNASPTSSDIDFGMVLVGNPFPPTTLAITNNPPDRTASESSSTTFKVGFSGTRANLQWYKWVHNVPIPIAGATRPSFTITNVSLADTGFYFVVLSNAINQVISANALLTVLVDDAGPRLFAAERAAGPSQLTLTFSERVSASTATNPANYYITNLTFGGRINVVSVTLSNETNVFLTLGAPLTSTDNYLVIVNGVEDISPQHNSVGSNSAVPISSFLTLIGLDEPGWDFYNPVLGPPWEPFEPPTNWNQIDFQVPENDWGHDGAGLFAYNPVERPLPAPVNTVLSGGAISSYFVSHSNSAPALWEHDCFFGMLWLME